MNKMAKCIQESDIPGNWKVTESTLSIWLLSQKNTIYNTSYCGYTTFNCLPDVSWM